MIQGPTASSFKDPAGFVFRESGLLQRSISQFGRAAYEELMTSGLYDALVSARLLIPHAEIATQANSYKTIAPEEIPVVSYPYEWCFSQLKDAALLTLRVQALALKHGMTLKDGTPFNVQFIGHAPIFIDTLSFESFRGRPWAGYRQFCETFLAPLALAAECTPDFIKYLRVDINGFDLPAVVRLLGIKAWLKPSYAMHLQLQRLLRSFGSQRADTVVGAFSPKQLLAVNASLVRAVESIVLPRRTTLWNKYYDTQKHYAAGAEEMKEEIIQSWIATHAPKQVLDIGGNNGRYSRFATQAGIYTVCADMDSFCVEDNYHISKKQADSYMLPMVVDFANPSSNGGWDEAERSSIFARIRPEMTLALAVIHHLRFTLGVPLVLIAQFLARNDGFLALEFIPKSDPMAQTLLAGRDECFADYDEMTFENCFLRFFTILERKPICSGERVLYLMKRR